MNSTELKNNLQQFIGTEYYHRLSILKVLATDGVRYFCDKAKAYWLFDEIASFITFKTKEPFVVVKINCADNKCTILYEDGNCKKLHEEKIPYTDLPEGEWKFYAIDKIVLLPSEY